MDANCNGRGNTFTGCSFVNSTEANKHTRAAVEALANAAAENARAIASIAAALKGGNAPMTSVRIGGNDV